MFTSTRFEVRSCGLCEGHGAAMIEVLHLAWVEGNGFSLTAVHPHGDPSVFADLLERTEVTISDLKRTVRSSQLYRRL
jgi:hypothetical protein